MAKKLIDKAMEWWRGWLRTFCLILLVGFSLRSIVVDWNHVPSGSMKPGILEGDRIFVNKLAYDLKVPFTTWHIAQWSDPKRGEVVIFFAPKNGIRMVKRAIGLPGDVVSMENNELIINGEKVEYGVADQEWIDAIPAELRPAHVFRSEVLGDVRHPVMLTPSVPGKTQKRRGIVRTFGPITVPEGQYLLLGDNRDKSRDCRYFGANDGIGFVERSRIVGRSSMVLMSLDHDRWFIPRWSRFFYQLP